MAPLLRAPAHQQERLNAIRDQRRQRRAAPVAPERLRWQRGFGALGPLDTLGDWYSVIESIISTGATSPEEIALATGFEPALVARAIRIAEVVVYRNRRHHRIRAWLDARDKDEADARGNHWRPYHIEPVAEKFLLRLGGDAHASVHELAAAWHSRHRKRKAAPFIPTDAPIAVPRRTDVGLLRVWLLHRQVGKGNQGAPVYRLEVANVELVGKESVRRQVAVALENGSVVVRVPSGREWKEAAEELAMTVLAVLPYATGSDARQNWAVRLIVDELALDHRIPLVAIDKALENIERRKIEASMGWGEGPPASASRWPFAPKDGWESVDDKESLKWWARHLPDQHFTEGHHIVGPWLRENIGLLDGEVTWLLEQSESFWREIDGRVQIIRDTRRKLAFAALVQGVLVEQGILAAGPCKGFRFGRKRTACVDPYGPSHWLNHDKPRQHRGKPHHLESMCPACNRARENTRNAAKSRAARKRRASRVTGSLS